MKDYLSFENARNKHNADLYTRLIKRAIGKDKEVAVLIGHHLCLELGGDLETENEIPSADCLMFDHELMKAVFGDKWAILIMIELARVPVEERDKKLARYLEWQEKGEEAWPKF